jgi:hypothetical protein
MSSAIIGAVLAPAFFTVAQECPQLLGGAIMRIKKETPRPGRALGVRNYSNNESIRPASILNQHWWGRQACTCRGAGRCLCCRRFDRAISAHKARVAAAGGC